MTRFRFFPVSYAVSGRRVLVIGNREAALQKLRLLVRTEADLVLVADDPAKDLAAFAAAHEVTRVVDLTDGEINGAALTFVATGDEACDARIAARMRASGVPVNVVDRPQLSDFATPSIVDRAPISIAIATDGHAPVLAIRLRGMIEALLPSTLGRLGELAAVLRERVLDRLSDPLARRRFWGSLFESRSAAVALAGDVAAAADIAIAMLDAATPARAHGRVSIVGTGTGAADLLTLRAYRLLLAADVVITDGEAPDGILAVARRDVERTEVRGHPPGEVVAILVRLAGAGKHVVRLVPGTAQLGAVEAEAAALQIAGIDVEVVPGIGPAPANPTTLPSREAA